jgi:DNA-binding transcriptional ArsR family regulator
MRMHADAHVPGSWRASTGQGVASLPPEEDVERAAAGLRLLGDPTRMKLLWALAQGSSSVGRLAGLVDASPAAVSQHLAKLRLAGLVSARRQGSYVYYSVADAHVTRLVLDALDHASHDDRDVAP